MRIAPARQGVKRIGRICGGAPSFLCGCAFARGAAGFIPSGAAARKKGKRRVGVGRAVPLRRRLFHIRCAVQERRGWSAAAMEDGNAQRGARLRGDGCSAAGSGRRQAKSGSERRIGGWKSGRRAQKQRRLCRRKIANRRRAKRFFVLPPKYRRLLPSFRQGGKRFYCFPVVARNVSAVPRRRAWRNEPTARTVGCAASSYDCPSAAVWEAARIFAGAKI